jgi:uncharacterized protein YhbP (UPF0306 family)
MAVPFLPAARRRRGPAPEPIMDPNIRHEFKQFLASARTLSLATVDGRGRAHAANVWYATDPAGRLYFISNPAAAHCRHLARRPDVAATVYYPTERANLIHGVQLHGRCARVAGIAETRRALTLFVAKFPQVLLSSAAARLKTERFYRLDPTWLRWIDNRRGFGFKAEWEPGRAQH